jgi:ribosomal protein S27AE
VEAGRKVDADDDRPPICPACGVTMGMTFDEDGSTRYVCLECGFSDDLSMGSELRASDLPPYGQDATSGAESLAGAPPA